MSWIDSRHRQISTGLHFQNGTTIPQKFNRLVEIFQCQESIRNIIIYLHMKCRWNRTMFNLCCIVVAILKMEPTLKNFYRSPFSKWLPQYRTNSTLSDFNDIPYVGRLNFDDIEQCWIFTADFFMPCFGSHFENGRHLENFENAELLLRW
jgi:hypothetical protein